MVELIAYTIPLVKTQSEILLLLLSNSTWLPRLTAIYSFLPDLIKGDLDSIKSDVQAFYESKVGVVLLLLSGEP